MAHDLFDLSGKVALVTGGSKGLGKSMARAFAQAGADILICSRSENDLKSAAADIGAEVSRRVEWLPVDMTDPQQVRALGKQALARMGRAGRNIYCSTKSALIGLARASAIDLGPWGITVNCIAPGPFLTDLPATILSEDQRRAFAERTALGRWARPEELAGPALLLAS